MLWKKKERSRIRALQIDNLRGFLGIRMMDIVPNARVREFCGVTKGVDDASAMWREWRIIGLLIESI